MAINYINAVFITRSKGHNALEAMAYRANEKLYCERTGKTFDYTNKDDCVHKEIMLPPSAFVDGISKKNHPLNDRENLWNKVEEMESRHNRHASAQLMMELKLALPKELNRAQQVELLQSFIRENYVNKYGVAADIAIHDNGDGNPHGHIGLTLRNIVGSELSKTKVRNMATQVLQGQNGHFCVNNRLYQQWANHQNEHFKNHEINLRVDQGYIIPTVHEGHVRDNPKYYEKAQDNVSIKIQNTELLNHPALKVQGIDCDWKSLFRLKTTGRSQLKLSEGYD